MTVTTLKPLARTTWAGGFRMRGPALVGGAHVFAIVGQLLLFKLVSNLVSPSDFGLYILVLAVSTATQWLLFGPLEQTALRFYQEAQEEGRLAEYLRTLSILATVAVLVPFSAILIIRADPIEIWLLDSAMQSTLFVTVGLLLGVLQGLLALGASVLNASRRHLVTSLFILFTPWGQVISVGVVYALGTPRLEGFLGGFAVALLAVLTSQMFAIWRVHRLREPVNASELPQNERSLAKPIARYALPFVLWAVPSYVMLYIDRWVLARFTDNDTVGMYGVMMVLTMSLMTSGMAALHRGLAPEIFALAGKGDEARRIERSIKVVRAVTYVLVAAVAPLLVVYYLWPHEIISVVSTTAYDAGAQFFWVLLLSALFFGMSQQATLTGLVVKKTVGYLWIRLAVGATASVVVPFSGARFGLAGVVYGVLAIQALHFAAVTFVNTRILKTLDHEPQAA